jgi:cytochrome c oxidase subunit 2
MRSRLPVIVAALALAGCEGVQSALMPAAGDAAAIAQLSWILFIGAALIFALVLGLITYVIYAPEEKRRWATTHRFILGGGLAFPFVTLTLLLIYGLGLTGGVGRSAEPPALRFDVTGEQFWWRVRYDGQDGREAITSANEINLPAGRPVELTLRTGDVIHSFWVPRLSGKLDMIPGQENRLVISAAEPGLFRGQCAEYCGIQHAQMAFYVVAHAEGDFAAWLDRERAPAPEPATDEQRRGRELFVAAGCGACHTVRGTPAAGVIGPDLTHVGSRHSIAAGMLPNNAGTLGAWIASSQHLKPGNRMPSFRALEGAQLRAVATYLESLK